MSNDFDIRNFLAKYNWDASNSEIDNYFESLQNLVPDQQNGQPIKRGIMSRSCYRTHNKSNSCTLQSEEFSTIDKKSLFYVAAGTFVIIAIFWFVTIRKKQRADPEHHSNFREHAHDTSRFFKRNVLFDQFRRSHYYEIVMTLADIIMVLLVLGLLLKILNFGITPLKNVADKLF